MEIATYRFAMEEIKLNDLFRVQAELVHTRLISCTVLSLLWPFAFRLHCAVVMSRVCLIIDTDHFSLKFNWVVFLVSLEFWHYLVGFLGKEDRYGFSWFLPQDNSPRGNCNYLFPCKVEARLLLAFTS